MGAIQTHREKCRKCYSCVRNCPVKAIKLDQDATYVIDSRCIGCGKCIRACSQNAKTIAGSSEITRRYFKQGEPVVAVLGCSFPAFFDNITPGQLTTAMRTLGFSEVHQGATGVELIRSAYVELLKEPGDAPIITSYCPSAVSLIEKHHPRLLPNLAPVVSPMIAIGRFIKTRSGAQTKVIYISSCIAGKFEIEAKETAGAIDQVLTYTELSALFEEAGIDLTILPETPFDGFVPTRGRLFAVSGGPFRAFDIESSPLDPDYIRAEGKEAVLEIIHDLDHAQIRPRVIDVRFCNGGCIGGPGRNSTSTTFAKRARILNYFKDESIPCTDSERYRTDLPYPTMLRSFTDKCAPLPLPEEESVARILKATDKFTPDDLLDCGCCGYETCQEYAVAVFRGFAEGEMCLPYSLRRMEEDRFNLAQKYELARRALDQEFGSHLIIGQDPKTQEVLRLIQQVGPTPTTVLIRGESGTGKELTARAIHNHSQRAEKPLVTVNCTAITDSLLESELFGHKKGAFTGAHADKKGLFESAHGGTIFLDEIGDITPKLQAELLRVIDNAEIRPVGSNKTTTVDVRLITATNKNLEEGVKEGWFREDLYYRLNVFTVTMPSLRERTDSIPVLAQHFITSARKKLNKKVSGIDPRALRALMLYNWPGNIRELQNIIERACVLTSDAIIKLECLPVIFSEMIIKEENRVGHFEPSDFIARRDIQVSEVERSLLTSYLREAKGNVTQAARRANIPRRTFYRMMERYRLTSTDFRLPTT